MPVEKQKIDASYKRFKKRQFTTTLKNWHEENPGKPFNIKFNEVWLEELPTDPPSSSTDNIEIIDLVMTEDVTVDGKLSWLACLTPGDLTTRAGDFIDPDEHLSNAYSVQVYDHNNTRIFVGDTVGWEFDYANGVLTFSNSPVAYQSPFHIKAYRYIGKKGTPEDIASTLDEAYNGPDGEGSGKIINVDFGPVTLNPSNGSAALQINPVAYTPDQNVDEGQIVNNAGILYLYDSSRSKWISMIRQNIIFGGQRADGRFLNVGDFSSNMAGWPALRKGVITGITAQASSGYGEKKFFIMKNNNPNPLLEFNLHNFYYANGNIDIEFLDNDLIKILASSEFGVAFHTIINLEIGWRLE